MPLATHPLFIEDRAANHEAKRGSALKRSIVVKNLGDRPAEVDLWIVATEQKAEPILRWCSFSERNPFRLEARESREVMLTFDIPQQATPDLYHYEVLVDAQAQYPDKPPIRRPQQFRVLPSTHDAEWGTDPLFSVQPVTQAANPYRLQAGEALDVTVHIKNCSKRVDRFYLTCPELPQSWFTVRYPESSLDNPGLVSETDGLELNPDSSGSIVLRLHPPQFTTAGHYFPTLRLTSSNDDTLQRLDVVYLQILTSDRLDVQLQPSLRRIPSESGLFDVQISNQGNVVRKLIVDAIDPEHQFRYRIEPFVLHLEPGHSEPLVIHTMPRKWWARPWWGKGREIPFDLHLKEVSGAMDAPKIPSTAQGVILWQARPWWMLVLLVLAGLGAVGAIALMVWLTLFKRPAPAPVPQPQIVAINPTVNSTTGEPLTYRAGKDETMRLDWTINRLNDIDRITIIHLEQGTEVSRKNYTFAGSIPKELQRRAGQQDLCAAVQEDTTQLSCRAMPIAQATPGTHTFRLQVFSRSDRTQPVDERTTDSLTIAALSHPAIVQFSPTAATYQSGSEVGEGAIAPPIRLNWEISSPEQIQEVQVMGITEHGTITDAMQRYSLADGVPPELQGFCSMTTRLVCRNVPTSATRPGTYTFQLTLIAKQSEQTIKQTPPIRIQATPPKVQSLQINGEDVGQNPTHRIELSADKPTTITFSWQIESDPDTQVELLPAPGSVPATGSLEYTLNDQPGQQPLTLRITNPSGEQMTRTILIETVAPPPEPAPPPTEPTNPVSPVPSPSPKQLILPIPVQN
ncbi:MULTISPECIES: hypothetical protein [unclassified Leptolyngbya]|uniref:COG1470 family protein n=1 Tax=unclassified Leptolyngbya TaxID=2650499 RepID=UPI001681DDBE|nr:MULTISPECIES: hypothetical protein [unclassified Leptolyngbya]MBD1909342.1 hypothetical protein [Leptolyngbya sp. FACHB-8]MBD2158200.1 hypothetical protein [Leptolyngbya sp. FACHB-16]